MDRGPVGVKTLACPRHIVLDGGAIRLMAGGRRISPLYNAATADSVTVLFALETLACPRHIVLTLY